MYVFNVDNKQKNISTFKNTPLHKNCKYTYISMHDHLMYV